MHSHMHAYIHMYVHICICIYIYPYIHTTSIELLEPYCVGLGFRLTLRLPEENGGPVFIMSY